MEKELEARLLKLEGLQKLAFRESYYWQAMALATRDSIIRLESKIDSKDFEEVRKLMEERRRWWHQKLLEETEKTSPRLAAESDDRPLGDVL